MMLERIATMTGGKTRDTLAGLYDDRAARRFAYVPLLPALALVAAVAMILGVGSRRLGIPDFLLALGGRFRGRVKQTEAERRASMAFAEAREKARREQQGRTNEALLARKQQRAPTPGSMGTILNVAPKPILGAKAPVGTPPKLSPSAPRPVAPSAGPKMSTAERLAQRRREKK